uniref:Carbamoyl phosphate synthase small chain n=1 Tax=Rhodymenia pseudopalmata TaxID=31502 RepID=A0A1C9C7Q1_RHOPU|nr:carbamoyl-phosphate synthase arginine-specific small subunit [Rhodymenia pseudopalmata]AOM64402.1 carbamoyl-phosphate synthase arginine-specific small subunit [Rhodymenia pseudopalmata]
MKTQYYPAILYLEDGTFFKGWSFNSYRISLGEVVFNTGMTGYQEIMTDPSYAGQMISFTYPEIGNTGINEQDYESSKIHIKGVISKSLCNYPSNWRSSCTFKDYILNNAVPHIFGIDTRSLTKHLRKFGTMNGCISSENLDLMYLRNIIIDGQSIERLDLVKQVNTDSRYDLDNCANIYSHINYKLKNRDNPAIHIAVIDFGLKYNILSRLRRYGFEITILSASTTVKNIIECKPSGILLSNGPGNPAAIHYGINTVKELIEFTNIPIFGICMGHQILSLALGGSTFKLKFGHRGLNHPSGIRQDVEITSQNHGFAVNLESIKKNSITHVNLNDLTLAGMKHPSKPIFSVQYHPEASPGPHDSEYLFEVFLKLLKSASITRY